MNCADIVCLIASSVVVVCPQKSTKAESVVEMGGRIIYKLWDLMLLRWWWWWWWSSSSSLWELCPVNFLEDSFVSNVCPISSTTTMSMGESFRDSKSHWKCKAVVGHSISLTHSLTRSPSCKNQTWGTPSLLGVLEETFASLNDCHAEFLFDGWFSNSLQLVFFLFFLFLCGQFFHFYAIFWENGFSLLEV